MSPFSRKKLIPFSLTCLFFLGNISRSTGLGITEVIFYPDKSTEENRKLSGAASRNKIQKLFARFTLIGGNESIVSLAKDGFLSVKVEWLRNGIVEANVEVGITQQVWDIAEEDLKNQVRQNGFFTYRTASFKTYVPPGNYTIVIRDSQGNTLAPADFPGLYQPSLKITMP